MELGKRLEKVLVTDNDTKIIAALAMLGMFSVLGVQPDVSISQKIFDKNVVAIFRCQNHKRCSMSVIKVDTNPPANYESRSITINLYGGFSGDVSYMVYVPDKINSTSYGRIGISKRGVKANKYP